ncbi:MAG: hypothetical protein ACI9KE_000427 [Polyangiales bacterium]|jgi:hypothetical protein
MFGSLTGDETPFEDDRDPQKRLRSLLPTWFATLTPRSIQRFGVAEKEARVAVEVLGL